MFKARLLLLTIPFATCSIGTKAVLPRPEDGLNYFFVSPFYLDKSTTTLIFSIRSALKKTYGFAVYLINDLYPRGIAIYKGSTSKTEVCKFYYNNQHTRPSGNSIRITVTGNGLNINTTHAVSVASGKTVLLGSNVSTVVAKAPSYKYTAVTDWFAINETLSFENFNDYYVADYYHKLDISSLKIHRGVVPDEVIMSRCNAALAISYQNGVFDEFPHSGSTAQISVNITQKGSDFLLSFPEMYVDKYTLRMSPNQLTNYVKTKYLYLPRNEKRFEENYHCSLVLNYIGADCNKYILQFTLKSLLNTMGDCRNSEYCIVNR